MFACLPVVVDVDVVDVVATARDVSDAIDDATDANAHANAYDDDACFDAAGSA